MTLTRDRRVALLAATPLFADLDAAGMRYRRAGRRGRLPGGPCHRPPGRHRDRVLRRRRAVPSGSSATARRRTARARASSSASCRSSTGGRASPRSSPTGRRPASPSRRGTSRRSCASSPASRSRSCACCPAPPRPDRSAPPLTADDDGRPMTAPGDRAGRTRDLPVHRHRGVDAARGADRHRAATPTLRERHRAILRAAFAAHGGEEQGTEGDSFFVIFGGARAAVAAAVTAQRAPGRRALARGCAGPRSGWASTPARRPAGGQPRRAGHQSGGPDRGRRPRRPDPRLRRDPGARRGRAADRRPPARARGVPPAGPRAPERLSRWRRTACRRLPAAAHARRPAAQPADPADDLRRPRRGAGGGGRAARGDPAADADRARAAPARPGCRSSSRRWSPTVPRRRVLRGARAGPRPDARRAADRAAVGVVEIGARPIAEIARRMAGDRHVLLVLDNFEQVIDAAPVVAGLLRAAADLKSSPPAGRRCASRASRNTRSPASRRRPTRGSSRSSSG